MSSISTQSSSTTVVTVTMWGLLKTSSGNEAVQATGCSSSVQKTLVAASLTGTRQSSTVANDIEGTVTNGVNGASPQTTSATIAAGTTGRRIVMGAGETSNLASAQTNTPTSTIGASQTDINKIALACTSSLASSIVDLSFQDSSASQTPTDQFAQSNRCTTVGAASIITAILPPQVITANLADSDSSSESVARAFTGTRAPTDTGSSSDTVNRQVTATRSESDTGSSSDTLKRALTALRALSDSATSSEVITKVMSYGRALTDSSSIADSLSRSFTGNRTVTDSASSSDTVNRQVTVSRSESDTGSSSDTLTRLYAAVRTLSDSATSNELLTRLVSFARSLTDSATISDTLTRIFTGNRDITDTANSSDTLSRNVVAARSLSDSASSNELVSRLQTAFRSLGDSSTIADALTRTVNYSRQLDDTASSTDLLTRIANYLRTLSDSMTSSETLTGTYQSNGGSSSGSGGCCGYYYPPPSPSPVLTAFPGATGWLQNSLMSGVEKVDVTVLYPTGSDRNGTVFIHYWVTDATDSLIYEQKVKETDSSDTYTVTFPISSPGSYVFHVVVSFNELVSREAKQVFTVTWNNLYGEWLGVIMVASVIVGILYDYTVRKRRGY